MSQAELDNKLDALAKERKADQDSYEQRRIAEEIEDKKRIEARREEMRKEYVQVTELPTKGNVTLMNANDMMIKVIDTPKGVVYQIHKLREYNKGQRMTDYNYRMITLNRPKAKAEEAIKVGSWFLTNKE